MKRPERGASFVLGGNYPSGSALDASAISATIKGGIARRYRDAIWRLAKMDRIESTASKPTCETIVNVVLFVVVIAISIEYEYVVDKMLAQGSSFAGQHENGSR